jgi:isopentenyl-diphosphate Delta-isomerase
MSESKTVQRKKDHIDLCLTDEVTFKSKTNGFENYEFEHFAATEINPGKIDLSTKFFSKKVNLPFIISCMTGGASESERINEKLAISAEELNIPIGVGSQRQALENKEHYSSYKVVRKNAGSVPVIGNIGAAQIAKSKKVVDDVKFLIDLIEADAMYIHLNPLQELLQKEGEPDFSGLIKNIEKLTSKINIPFMVKEVGSGINESSAKIFLDAGIKGIDVAGAGGTSWAAVELFRNNNFSEFRDWGMPTSYCIRTVNRLRKNYNFILISSGGITNGEEIAKSISLGADFTASARPILQEVVKNDVKGTIDLINSWFVSVKNIMYLTGCSKIKNLQKINLIRKSEMY